MVGNNLRGFALGKLHLHTGVLGWRNDNGQSFAHYQRRTFSGKWLRLNGLR